MEEEAGWCGACSPLQMLTSAAVGGVGFFILGTVGNLRRAPLPLVLNLLFNLNRTLLCPSWVHEGYFFIVFFSCYDECREDEPPACGDNLAASLPAASVYAPAPAPEPSLAFTRGALTIVNQGRVRWACC